MWYEPLKETERDQMTMMLCRIFLLANRLVNEKLST